jgi:O-antigen ligase
MGRIGSEGIIDEGRWQVYGFSIEAIRQRPLFGAGAGTFEGLLPSLRTADFNNWGVWDYAHSTILEIAVEMGLPLAGIIVVAACASIIFLARCGLRSDDQKRAGLAAVTGIAVLSYLHSMIDFSLQIPGYLILFAVLIGCGLAQASSEETARRRRRSHEYASIVPAVAKEDLILESSNAQAPNSAD